MDKEYLAEIEKAKEALKDIKERGSAAIGPSWEEVREQLFTPEERAASDLRVAMMLELIQARKEKGISQKKLEEMSGVRQPVIARMERGYTSPQVDTLLKVLAPLGKTLSIVPLPTA